MTLVPLIKRDYICNLAKKGKRIDGRKFEDFRNIQIETNVISKAEGSAKVKLGNTQVITGVKMDMGEPYPDTPDSGVLTTAAELIPMASPDFEAGPPQADAIELARVVDRGVRESEAVDVGDLCIAPNKKVWIVFIDIHILDYDGNLFDAASLSTLAALMTTKVPISRFKEIFESLKDEMPDVKKYLEKHPEDYDLPMTEPPISCTSVKFDGNIIIDPSLDEEQIAEARLTVATDEKGDIRAMQKGLSGSFDREEIQKVIKASLDNGQKIRKILKDAVGK